MVCIIFLIHKLTFLLKGRPPKPKKEENICVRHTWTKISREGNKWDPNDYAQTVNILSQLKYMLVELL